MALKQTINQLKNLLEQITQDINKSESGNKAASQRVRTGTIRLEKVAKQFRKESVKAEKQTQGKKEPATKAAERKATRKPAKWTTAASKKKPAAPKAVKKKTMTRKTAASARPLSFKRKPTAKLKRKTAR